MPDPSPKRPARPVAPVAAPSAPEPVDEPVSLPAPRVSPSVQRKTAKRKPARRTIDDLTVRRTMIPVLLTLGFFMGLIGAAQWIIDPDYPFSAHNLLWVAIALPILSAVLFGAAALNMLHVRAKLATSSKAR